MARQMTHRELVRRRILNRAKQLRLAAQWDEATRDECLPTLLRVHAQATAEDREMLRTPDEMTSAW